MTIPYSNVRNGSRYWELGKTRQLATGLPLADLPAYKALGPDDLASQQKALSLYAAYRRAILKRDANPEDRLGGWPVGSLGACFHAYQRSEDWTVDKKPRTREEWLAAWVHIAPRFGEKLLSQITVSDSEKFHRDCRKQAVLDDGTKTDGLGLSPREAWSTIKIWRAILNMLAAKHLIDKAPIGSVDNPMPEARAEFWIEEDVARLMRAACKLSLTCHTRADRERFRIAGLIIRLAWETAMSAVDCRTFSLDMTKQDQRGIWRIERTRSKSGAKAKPSLSVQLVEDLQAYAKTLSAQPMTGQALFRNTDGNEWTRTYLAHAFADVRRVAFGKQEKRQLQDLRRSANLEAELGGATAADRAALLANRIDGNKRLEGTYTPTTTLHANRAQQAREAGRALLKQELGRKKQ